jgi:acyl-coenzyme A thioesterase PaaI-like protein
VLLDTVGGMHLLARRPELARIAHDQPFGQLHRTGPVRPGLVLATAEIQHIGGSVADTSMALHAGDFAGELLATAHGAYRLFHAAG